jgi:hypothetical protein
MTSHISTLQPKLLELLQQVDAYLQLCHDLHSESKDLDNFYNDCAQFIIFARIKTIESVKEFTRDHNITTARLDYLEDSLSRPLPNYLSRPITFDILSVPFEEDSPVISDGTLNLMNTNINTENISVLVDDDNTVPPLIDDEHDDEHDDDELEEKNVSNHENKYEVFTISTITTRELEDEKQWECKILDMIEVKKETLYLPGFQIRPYKYINNRIFNHRIINPNTMINWDTYELDFRSESVLCKTSANGKKYHNLKINCRLHVYIFDIKVKEGFSPEFERLYLSGANTFTNKMWTEDELHINDIHTENMCELAFYHKNGVVTVSLPIDFEYLVVKNFAIEAYCWSLYFKEILAGQKGSVLRERLRTFIKDCYIIFDETDRKNY